MIRRPPAPTGDTDKLWPRRIYEYLVQKQREDKEPRATRLRAKLPDDRPVTDGIILYDREENAVVVSIGGQWRKIALVP